MKTFGFHQYSPQLTDKLKLDPAFLDAEYKRWVEDFGTSKKDNRNFTWGVFNRLLYLAPEKFPVILDRYQHLRNVYFQMWSYLLDEGKESSHIYKHMLYCDLMIADASDYKVNIRFIATKCCAECDKINGTVMPLSTAIEEQPLPHKDCTKAGGCICLYAVEAVRDGEGRLVKK